MRRAASIEAWVGASRQEVPERLLQRVGELVAGHPAWEGHPVPEAFRAAGEQLLGRVLAAGQGAGRASALDLLAADACVTWAFEAGADEPATIGRLAEDAMRRIAGMAT